MKILIPGVINTHIDFDNCIDPDFSWIRELKDQWSLKDKRGKLSLKLLKDPNGLLNNLLLRNTIDGDWSISTKVTLTNENNSRKGGLIVYQDDNNYLLLDVKNNNGQKVISWEEGSKKSGTVNCSYSENLPVYFKFNKNNNSYTGYYSIDGINWLILKTWNKNFSNIKIGVVSYKDNNNIYSDDDVFYDWFDYYENQTESLYNPGNATFELDNTYSINNINVFFTDDDAKNIKVLKLLITMNGLMSPLLNQ